MHGSVHGEVHGWLDLGVGRGLDGDGDGEEVVGVVSCEMEIYLCFFNGVVSSNLDTPPLKKP